jgi:hypothetical protein
MSNVFTVAEFFGSASDVLTGGGCFGFPPIVDGDEIKGT